MQRFLKNMYLGLFLLWSSSHALGSNGSSTVLRSFTCGATVVYVLDSYSYRALAFTGLFNISASFQLLLPFESFLTVEFVHFSKTNHGVIVVRSTQQYFSKRAKHIALENLNNEINIIKEGDVNATPTQSCQRIF